MTTSSAIRDWLLNAPGNATHMVVICDQWDYTDYPKYTTDPLDCVNGCTHQNMQLVMEVYDLRKDFEPQLHEVRAWNF